MKKIIIALSLGLLPLVSGCQTLARVSGSEQVATYDEKTLITLELGFQQAMVFILAANDTGNLTNNQKAQLLPKVVQARAFLVKAREAYDTNSRAEAAINQNRAALAIAEIVGLLEQWKVIK